MFQTISPCCWLTQMIRAAKQPDVVLARCALSMSLSSTFSAMFIVSAQGLCTWRNSTKTLHKINDQTVSPYSLPFLQCSATKQSTPIMPRPGFFIIDLVKLSSNHKSYEKSQKRCVFLPWILCPQTLGPDPCHCLKLEQKNKCQN